MKTLSLIFGLIMQATLVLAQNQYFVSLQGDDAATGCKDAPFRTIERALSAARNGKNGASILIREGVYRLEHPIVITSADGGPGHSLEIRPYADEHVTLSGGIRLRLQWKPYRNGIVKAAVGEAIGDMDMLLVNGSIRPMARYPNYDSTAVRFNGTSADATSPKRIRGWKHPEGGYLHAMHISDWGDFHYRITGKDKTGKLQLEGGWQNNRQSGLHPENRMVENIFEELDAPGEWYYDRRSSTLYYYPMAGENLKTAVFETPVTKHLIELRGSEAHPVRNITIRNLELVETRRTFMEQYEPLLRSDWTIYRGGAVLFEGTEDCSLSDCSLHELGGNAVFFSDYNRHSSVRSCHITRVGASAVCFVGDPGEVRSPCFEYNQSLPADKIDRTPGPKRNNFPAYCVAYDNLIHSIGLFEKQVAGVEISMSSHITVSHNSIYDTPRSGINVSEGTWGGHVVEYNDVFDTVKETGDHGSFNSWGRDRYWRSNRHEMDSIVSAAPELILADAVSATVLRNNRFRCDRGWDIDLDDGSSNYLIRNNLCLNGGIKLREGFYRTVEDNVIVNNSFHPHVWFANSGDRFEHNVVMTAYRPIGMSCWGAVTDWNVFADSASLRKSLQQGTDSSSIVCIPHFIQPEEGDYRIAPEQSEVFRSGFVNFDMDCFGVESSALRRIARLPVFPRPTILTEGKNQADVSWHGLRVKDLNTLGERSATGMDSERGVYVISVDAIDSPLRDYLKPNDVILGLNGKPVNNMSDLRTASALKVKGGSVIMVVFRNQNKIQLSLPRQILK